MNLPIVLGQPLTAWSGVVALLVALIALAVALRRPRFRPGEPVAGATDEAWRAGFEQRLPGLEAGLPEFVRHKALVRFDAFPGAGGRFSFSAAFLDGARTGLLLTAISARDDMRLYAKWVENGQCEQALSPEEEAALAQALGGAKGQGRG